MYSTCLFCNQPLGANEVIEAFPVGRRLAFDAAKARLWVVCRRCERWNLSPFDERWDAIEQAERLYRDARKRVSSDNIGLAKLDEGLELVRIGEPLRPEFAAWRYGDQFGRRRRRAMYMTAGGAALVGGIVIGGAWTGIATGGGYWMYQLVEGLVKQYRRRRVVARVSLDKGPPLVVRGAHLSGLRFVPDSTSLVGWNLQLKHNAGTTVIRDFQATHAAALVLPAVNRAGGNRRRVQQAVREIENRGGPDEFMKEMVRVEPRPQRRSGKKGLFALPIEMRLAIEMALNEENERIALEGELALLELAWKDAEEIAAIADSLTIPEDVDRQLKELKRSGR